MQQEAGVASPFPAPAYELANDPTPPEPPGVVDYAEALKLRERDIVTQVQERREESRRARKVLELERDEKSGGYILRLPRVPRRNSSPSRALSLAS